jgi:hypothetical protein
MDSGENKLFNILIVNGFFGSLEKIQLLSLDSTKLQNFITSFQFSIGSDLPNSLRYHPVVNFN